MRARCGVLVGNDWATGRTIEEGLQEGDPSVAIAPERCFHAALCFVCMIRNVAYGAVGP